MVCFSNFSIASLVKTDLIGKTDLRREYSSNLWSCLQLPWAGYLGLFRIAGIEKYETDSQNPVCKNGNRVTLAYKNNHRSPHSMLFKASTRIQSLQKVL